MPKIYYCGLTSSNLINKEKPDDSGTLTASNEASQVLCEDMTDIEIGWDYFLIWKSKKLYASGKFSSNDDNLQLLEIPNYPHLIFKQAIAGPENVTIITDSGDLWIYNIHTSGWKKVADFIPSTDASEKDRVVKASQGRCSVALTNSGHVFNIPIMLNNPEAVEFVDVACGFDHTILLAKNGEVYSVGMGTRGQLGHGDLEDCDEPKLIEALAGLKVVHISASGWHSAVITNQGDLYTWGWNNKGQLGLPDVENVAAVPTIVDFNNDNGDGIEINVSKVQCGNAFTICRTDNGEFWGCGSNKYGQMGLPRTDLPIKRFISIKFSNIKEPIEDFKCREWGTCIYVK